MRPVDKPWGGGNWFLRQLIGHLERSGYDVRCDLDTDVNCIVALDPRAGGNIGFAAVEILAYRARHPGVRCLHRINENDAHRGGGTLDAALAELNAVADYTVFVSEWLRDYHAETWFDRARPHDIVHNGADPAVYHPIGGERWQTGQTLRLVTHHWSDNPFKGFRVYVELDRLIAEGELPETELWVIGRWPAGIEWRTARAWPPTAGRELADLLRSAHVYVTGSLWDPGPMHIVEGAQCGLPLVYHEDGGGIVEIGSRFGVGFRDDVAAAVDQMRDRYDELRARVLAEAPSGDAMCARYRRIIERLLVA
jgi:glycosyltransferase involved in cell wall biosynthesis